MRIRLPFPACLMVLVLAVPATGQRALLPDDSPLKPSAPHVAVGVDGRVAVAFAVDDTIHCALSTDGGERFGAPVPVGASGRLERGVTRGPKVALAGEAIVIVAVCGEQLRGRDGDLQAWRSTDGGATWTGPARVNDVADAVREGLHALAAGPDGRLLCAWLDLRSGSTELWGSWSTDGGASWSADERLYASPGGTICECCHPTVAFDPASGDAVAMWRNALEGRRDMWAARWTAAGEAAGDPFRLGSGHWKLNACPMAGGGLAIDAAGAALSFWRRRGGLFTAAASGPAGEQAVTPGRAARIAAGPEGFVLLWSDAEGRLLARRVGAEAEPRSLGQGSNAWLAGAPDGRGPVVAVFETDAQGAGRLRSAVLVPRAPPQR